MAKRGRPYGEKTQFLVELVRNNSHLERLQVMELIWQTYPGYSEDQFRMLIYTHKLVVKKSPRRSGPPPLAPGRQKPKPAAPVRASVHSYHGRSRLSAGYTEL